jgi:hypothetical protein
VPSDASTVDTHAIVLVDRQRIAPNDGSEGLNVSKDGR